MVSHAVQGDTADSSTDAESRNYLTQICAIFLQHLQRVLHDDGTRRHLVPKARLNASQTKVEAQLQQTESYLKGLLKTLPRRPSKRTLRANGNGDVSMASTTSIMTRSVLSKFRNCLHSLY
jgi:hypothetical protein